MSGAVAEAEAYLASHPDYKVLLEDALNSALQQKPKDELTFLSSELERARELDAPTV